jgi:hypothetical protein
MKYRKKPVVIEAIQFDGSEDSASEVCRFADGKAERVPDYRTGASSGAILVQIKTLEGVMTADVGDFVIRGVNGEFYPCKPDIFAATYEPEFLNVFDFGHAVLAMKLGKKVRRAGWNGPNQYAVLMPGYPEGVPANAVTARAHGIPEGTLINVRPYMVLHTAQGDLAMWAPSGSDALAEDWELAE